MESFVLKTLKKMRKEAPRRFKDLRDLCDELIAALSDKEKANGGHSVDTDADQYFEPLEMACQTRQPRLMEIALNAVHFLVEHGFLKGKKMVEPNPSSPATKEDGEAGEAKTPNPPCMLIDVIVDTVSKCSDEADDGVQLQVIKVLLMTITSVHCEVHEASLLLAVRACFHIHLISKNLINKTTAKAALTQIISVTNQRMESKDVELQLAGLNQLEIENQQPTFPQPPSGVVESTVAPPQAPQQEPEPQESGSSKSGGPIDSLAAAAPSAAVTTQQGASLVFRSIYHKDAYLLFRALCKLSMKGLSEETQYAHTDAIPLQNKVLSLELILHILQNSGTAFRTEDKFIYAVRTYLCVSLLSNCTSHVAQVTGLSLQIFIVLMEQFKEHLKHEMEVFVSNIFLRMLESENSTYDHKFRVLEVFQTICKDPKSQVELFMNYDCDLEAINLFSRIVHGLAKIAKNPALMNNANRSVSVDFMSSSNKKAQQEEHHVRMLGLECLVSIVQSLEVSAGLSSHQLAAHDAATRRGSEMNGAAAAAALAAGAGSGDVTGNSSTTNISALEAIEEEPTPSAGQSHNNNMVDVFDKKQKLNEELETGILKFNLSQKAGLAYLAKTGHIEMTPKSVADFFHQYQDRLDKTAVGDYLGREREYMDGFCLKVLNEYVEVMDFADMPFDLAIRYFLGGFRLPGEAQKIDRIMEKFAERYYLQNREVFASADMAFILAFSTIMLQTNLHNPAIKDDKRMTKEQFLKQNKGISADGELPEDLLLDIYDRIAAQPISINNETDKTIRKPKKEEQPSFVMFQATTDKMKKDAFNQERKEMVRAGEAMIKLSAKRNSTAFVRNSTQSDEAYARPMFDIVWPPMIGVLSQLLETHDDPAMVQLCLTGFHDCIQIACRLDFPTARNTFINVLLKFTTLDAVREMKPKHVACIKLMMDLAISEGDYLEESWLQVLQTVSRLARLQLFASGSHTDDIFFSDMPEEQGSGKAMNRRGSVSTNDPFMKMFMGPSRAETTRLVEEANAELVMKTVDNVMVDRLFSHSINLSGPSVRHFVEYLCQVSVLELTTSSSMNSLRGKDSATDASTPRIFSLQKLVEVADYNMFRRSRMDWANMWSLLAKHFAEVGLHANQNVAMYAIDSLKQLSVKFLQKDELSNFNFQRVFLTPFEAIMTKTKSHITKELVLNCLEVMIRSCAVNIHSGWRTIFAIFTAAACQELGDIAANAFHIIESLMNTHFELLIYDFVELMNCLVSFATSMHTNLSLRALDLLFTCADHLAGGRIDPAVDAQNASSDTMGISWEKSKPVIAHMNEDASVFRLWWPLLLGLSTSVADSRLKVRVKALETLQEVLRKHGGIFSPQTLSVIFKGVLFPMIDSAKTDSTQQPKSAWPTENPPPSRNMLSWIGTVGASVLMMYIDLFKLFGEKEDDSVPLLPDIISALEGCINQDTESLAKLGMNVLSTLVLTLGVEADSDVITTVSKGRTDLVCNRVVAAAVNNLCTDFGESGALVLRFEQVPAHVKALVPRCPLAQRRRVKLGLSDSEAFGSQDELNSCKGPQSSMATAINTPFGDGTITEFLNPDVRLNVPRRNKIELEWGATLFSGEHYQEKADGNASEAAERASGELSNTSFLGKDQSWPQLASAAMTSMVVTLDFIQLTKELLVAPNYQWDLQNYAAMLNALEAVHWHAFCFNENSHLRLQLQQRGFMNKNRSAKNVSPELPHLLEQEVLSMEQLLFTVFRLYCHNKHQNESTPGSPEGKSLGSTKSARGPVISSEAEVFAEPLVERLSSLVLMRYLSFEEAALRKLRGMSSSSKQHDDDGDSSDEEFATAARPGFTGGGVLSMADFLRQKHDAYKSPALIVLEGMMDFTHSQFQSNVSWIIPLLSRLVICEDVEVRVCVRQIYQSFVNFLLIK